MSATNPENIDELEENSEYDTQKYCWQILFAAGSHLGFCPFIDYIKSNCNQNYFSLLHLCRTSLRRHLLKANRNSNLFYMVPKLKIPQVLKSYLLYNMSLENENLIAGRTPRPYSLNWKHSQPTKMCTENSAHHRKFEDCAIKGKQWRTQLGDCSIEEEISFLSKAPDDKSEITDAVCVFPPVKKKRPRKKIVDDFSMKEKQLRRKVAEESLKSKKQLRRKHSLQKLQKVGYAVFRLISPKKLID